jgi:hypothetical protein
MKKIIILIASASLIFLSGCGLYGSGFKQNTGLTKKSVGTIAVVKGGGRFCKH